MACGDLLLVGVFVRRYYGMLNSNVARETKSRSHPDHIAEKIVHTKYVIRICNKMVQLRKCWRALSNVVHFLFSFFTATDLVSLIKFEIMASFVLQN